MKQRKRKVRNRKKAKKAKKTKGNQFVCHFSIRQFVSVIWLRQTEESGPTKTTKITIKQS